ncbi:MAG: hypothetical protein JRN20_12340 [Nitrososphaerota archaeon]|nr:hypothetical protein [Nitrososphaerota archaeon]
MYKVLVYNQLSPEEVAKSNIDIHKVSFWAITASAPGSAALDDPHVTVFWYGPNVSSEKGLVVYMKAHKLDKKYTESIASVVAAKVGGTPSEKESGTEFKNFTMKISYASIAELANEIKKSGNLNCDCTLEYEMVSKQEKAQMTIPKTKLLGEKPLEK